VSQENVQLLRRGIKAWNAGDIDALLELLDPDVEWTFSDRFPDAIGTVQGKDAVVQFLRTFSEPWAQIETTPRRIVEAGDDVVVDVEFVARSHEGAEVKLRLGHVWTGHNGRCTRFRAYPTFAEALQAVGLEE
jgi:ketosteroid isomerase-like protein